MVDFATLDIRIDSSAVDDGVKKLDSLTAAGAKAEGAVDRLETSMQGAGRSTKGASAAAAEYAANAQRSAAAAMGAGGNIGKMGGNAKLSANQVQNLTFQLNDMFVGLASGQKPMTVFMQQGAQIGQIAQQAGLGIGGMARALLGLAGAAAAAVVTNPLLLGIAAAAGVAVGAFKMFQAEVAKTGELQKFVDTLGLTKNELEELGPVTITFGDVMSGLWTTIREGLGLDSVFSAIKDFAVDAFNNILSAGKIAIAGIYAGFVGTYNGIKAVWSSLPAVLGEVVVGAANAVIDGLNFMLSSATNSINVMISNANSVLGIFTDRKIGMLEAPQISRIANSYAGAGKAAGDAFGSAYADAYADAMGGMDRFGATLSGNIRDAARNRLGAEAQALIDDRPDKKGAAAARDKAKALTEAEKAYKAALKAAQDYLANLTDETSKIGKTAVEIKKMEIAAAAAKAPTQELRDAILAAGQAWEKATQSQAVKDFMKNTVEPLEKELKLLGLVGPEREKAALMLEREAIVAQYGVEAWNAYYAAKMRVIEGNAAIDAEKKRIDELNESFRNLINSLDQLGGVGKALGNIGAIVYGLQSGDFTGVTGKVGSVLNILNQTKAGKEGFKVLADKLDGIFGGTGSFTNTMKSILDGAGLGLGISSAVFGNSKTSQIGGAIGGALGQVAGEALGKVVGGTLGKALGPLGSIAGSLLGGALGSLLSKTPRASATLSLDGVSTTGNSGKLKAAATSAGNSVLDALAKLAEQLGGELGGTISTSIGIRKGNYRVDTTGKGITKTSKGAIDFGEDAEAAVKFAIADAIKDGAITGLRAGTQALIRAGNDIERQLDKALKFENVFKELKQRTDPVGFALGELAKEFEAMKKIFAEAGASAAEYADLEKLYLLKREDAIKQANSAALDLARDRRSLEIRIMELQGNAAAALAAARELEIEQMDASLRPLQRIIYQMEDLREQADKFTQLATGLKEYRDTLFASDVANGNAYVNARNKFLATSALAVSGNADAMGQLEGVSRDFLTQAKDNAGSFAQYQRDVAAVVNAVDQSIFAAESTADYAQLQLDALSRSEVLLANIDSNIASIAPALQAVEPLNDAAAILNDPTKTDALLEEMRAMRASFDAMTAQNALTQSQTMRLFTRWDGDGLLIRTDADTPIQTEVV